MCKFLLCREKLKKLPFHTGSVLCIFELILDLCRSVVISAFRICPVFESYSYHPLKFKIDHLFVLWLVVVCLFVVSVSTALQAFCEELETMIQDQLKKGKTPTSLLALQQIADFMTTSMPSMYPAAPQGGMAALNMSKQRREWLCVTS